MKVDYQFINFGLIDLMIKTFDFIYKFLTIGSFRNKYLQINVNTSEISKDDDSIIFYRKAYQELKRFKESLDILSIKNSIVIKNERDLSKIATLNKIIIDNEISGTSLEGAKGYNLFLETIGDDKFLLFFDSKKSRLINPFKEFSDNQYVYFKNQGKRVSTSFFLILEPEYFKASNFDFEAVEKSLKHINFIYIDLQFPNINQFVLNLLKTYDILSESKYLKLVESIYSKVYHELEDEQDRVILLINYLQSIKRRRGTIKKFIPRLYKILENGKDNLELQFCIQVLLEDKEEAYINFKNLEKSTQLDYINYPIYTLYKKLE